MPGSPTRTLRRVERFEQRAIELSYDLVRAAPASFVNPPDSKPVPFPRDPLRPLWLDAVNKSMAMNVALETLGDHLREKAGNGAVGPFEEPRAGMAGATLQTEGGG